MTEDKLKEIEARLNAATPGPWPVLENAAGYEVPSVIWAGSH